MNGHQKWLEEPYEAHEVAHEFRLTAIKAEADALMREWVDFGAAMRDVDGYELLLEERTSIVNAVAFFLNELNGTQEMEDAVKTVIADKVIALVRQAALKVATHMNEVTA